jgi:hypothetical protein
VTVTDANGATATAGFSLTVNGAVTATQVIASKMLTVNVAATSFIPVTGGGGTSPLSYGVTPSLPTGLNFSASTGVITGTPTVTLASANFTVTVTDANGATATAGFSLAVNGAVTATQAIASKMLTVNAAATSFIPVTGGGGTSPLSYGVSPSLPTGLNFSSSTGAITGTPTVTLASTNFTVTVTDANGATATAGFSLTVNGAVTATQVIASKTLTVNVAAASFTPVTGSGGTAPLSYSVLPALPTGLNFSTSSGAVTGTPTVTSTSTNYTVTVTDANGATATAGFSLTVTTVSTSTALASSLNPSQFGQSVSFTATVTSVGGTPTGSVTFKDGSATIGTVTLNGAGVAVLTISSLVVGSHSITASYAGTSTFVASASNPLIQAVGIPADSIKLRQMQVSTTPMIAQVSGQAITGAIDNAISAGFSGNPKMLSPNGSGFTYYFGGDTAAPSDPDANSLNRFLASPDGSNNTRVGDDFRALGYAGHARQSAAARCTFRAAARLAGLDRRSHHRFLHGQHRQ